MSIVFKDVLVELLVRYYIFINMMIIFSIFCIFNMGFAGVDFFSRFIAEVRLIK